MIFRGVTKRPTELPVPVRVLPSPAQFGMPVDYRVAPDGLPVMPALPQRELGRPVIEIPAVGGADLDVQEVVGGFGEVGAEATEAVEVVGDEGQVVLSSEGGAPDTEVSIGNPWEGFSESFQGLAVEPIEAEKGRPELAEAPKRRGGKLRLAWGVIVLAGLMIVAGFYWQQLIDLVEWSPSTAEVGVQPASVEGGEGSVAAKKLRTVPRPNKRRIKPLLRARTSRVQPRLRRRRPRQIRLRKTPKNASCEQQRKKLKELNEVHPRFILNQLKLHDAPRYREVMRKKRSLQRAVKACSQ